MAIHRLPRPQPNPTLRNSCSRTEILEIDNIMKQQKITTLTIPIIMTPPTRHNHFHSLLYSMLTTSLTKQSTKPNEYETAMTDASSRKLSPRNALLPIKYSMHKQITRTIRKQSTKDYKKSLRTSSMESAKYRPHLKITTTK